MHAEDEGNGPAIRMTVFLILLIGFTDEDWTYE